MICLFWDEQEFHIYRLNLPKRASKHALILIVITLQREPVHKYLYQKDNDFSVSKLQKEK